jgi:hypothetical protein
MPIDIGGVATLTGADGTGFGKVLSLDGASKWMGVSESGILTRPQTPYFCGKLTGRGAPYKPADGNPLLITADVNQGSCWNNATGYFTCPVAGKYLITGAGIMSANSGYFYIRKNGVEQIYTHWNHASSWHYVPISLILQCAASDYIYYTLERVSPATAGIYGETGHQMFSIALMV